jgi:DNA repair photolyase
VNPYRGCAHACAYCYARPTHQYLGFGAGTDFDRRIVVKVNAPALLERTLARRAWRGDFIAFSGATDCYQPLEAHYRLTRACLEVCLARGNAVGVVTKSALVRRDADVLAALAAHGLAAVYVSIPFADDTAARAIEPGAAPPSERFRTLAALASAGIPVGVAVAPIIPGLNDHAIPEILQRAAAAGATRAFRILLRLPAEVAPVFRERVAAAFPDRAARVFSNLRQARGGRENDPRFGARMRGEGPRWDVARALFDTWCRKLGLNQRGLEAPAPAPTPRPLVPAPSPAPGQGRLFL